MKLKNKIVLGTMKLRKYYNKSSYLSKFLDYAQKNGINKFHVSNEYDSYNLLVRSLKNINTKKLTFILKVSESKKDYLQFNIKKFIRKIYKYREDLGRKHTYIIQLVNRYKCNTPKEYLLNEQKTFESIKSTITKLKKIKVIKSFYFFPYYININKTEKFKFIDGITIYRNLKDRKSDNYAMKNNFKIIAMRTFGGNNKIIKKINLKKLIMFNLKNKLVKKTIIGANNKAQLDQILEAC